MPTQKPLTAPDRCAPTLLISLLALLSGCGGTSTAAPPVVVVPPKANTVTATIALPTANLTVTSGAAVDFSATGTDSSPTATLTYAWTFGDGASASLARTAHTYVNTGAGNLVVTVALIVMDNTGVSASATRNLTIQGLGSPPAGSQVTAFITSPAATLTVPAGTAVPFAGAATDSAGAATFTYVWAFGDGQAGFGSATTHTYLAPGAFTATLTATNQGGQSGTTFRTILVAN
jgi:PKD repeat protein